MSDNKNLPVDENTTESTKSASKSESKKTAKKPNFFVKVWNKICKFSKDVVGEMRKVSWTPVDELKKSTNIVLITVVAFAVSIAIVDTAFSVLINYVAGLIG